MASEPELWRRSILPLGSTLQQAIQSLEHSGVQIVLVVSGEGVLQGTLTDGDIRRALLRGFTLQSEVNEIVHRNPLVAPREMGREMVLQLMQANRVHQVPVVDEARNVVGLHLWDEILAPSSRPNTMVIMAGGRGVRLRPHTENCPKPMLDVGGKPMMLHIIERARAAGISDFVVAIHYLGRMVEDYFGDGTRWGVRIRYLQEESPLGTAGALGLLPKRPEEPFVVTNGDVMSDVNYGELIEFHARHQATATMAVRLHEIQNPFGVVRISGVEIAGFEEKPVYRSHINAGIYVLSPQALDLLRPGESCDMPTLFERARNARQRVIVYPMHEPWLDVGRPDDLVAARHERK